MISKNSYKALYLFLCLLIIIILKFPHEGHAQIFFSEDWDNGTPPTDWPCKNFPNAYTTSTFNGWEPKDYDLTTFGDAGSLSGLSTAIYHSAPRSYYQHRPANNYATCDILKYLPQPYPTKINLRFYIYFTDNWSHFNEGLAGEVVHLIFLGQPVSGSGWKLDIREYVSEQWPYECSRATQPTPNMYFFPSFAARGTNPYDCYNLIHHLKEWQCVEIMTDAANDRYSLWINGDQKVNNVSTPVDTTIDRIVISGWNSLLRDYTGDFYIDDIVVADSYIGCGDSGNTPPSSGSGGDSASGGSGCGFVKENNSNTVSKSQSNKAADIGLMIMLVITLCLLPIAKRLFKSFNRQVL